MSFLFMVLAKPSSAEAMAVRRKISATRIIKDELSHACGSLCM